MKIHFFLNSGDLSSKLASLSENTFPIGYSSESSFLNIVFLNPFIYSTYGFSPY